MKIVSWNVNGLVACKRNGFLKVLERSKADVFCCQEIKTRCSLTTPGYLQYWNPAQRKGYSGTLALSRREPLSVQFGMGIERFDCEGRMIVLEYESFEIINLYVPNSQASKERLDYRVGWDAALLEFLQTRPKPVILCGDFNVARDYIDIYPENLRNEPNAPGFLAEEREGMDRLLAAGYADVFRTLNPATEGNYTWWSNRMNKRLENRGWRLDYFLISQAVLGDVETMAHHTDTLGSDHCPISLKLTAKKSAGGRLTDEDMAVMWRGIDWAQMEDQLLDLQKQLARTAFAKSWKQVTELQKRLVRSLAAKVLAVRHVIQVNSEPGVDGVRWKTDGEKMRAALSLTSRGYRAKPYRQLIITDNGKDRRINIPTAYDKAMQVLYAFSLDSVAESTADRKSFSFRKGRSMMDANAYLCQALDGDSAPRWIVRADVKAHYDSISHKWLLANIPMDRKVLAEFLRAGAVLGGELFPTDSGISQGSSLSPILGNMALDGLQTYLFEHLYPDGDIDYGNGNLIRFADDMIITARTGDAARTILALLEDFLRERGLALNQEKSYITNIDLGLEFLSRWYQRRDGILLVTPSPKAVSDLEQRLETFIFGFKGSQKSLIDRLNRRLIGWSGYHRITDCEAVFRRIDTVVQGLLARKMRMLHPRRQWGHIVKRYWLVNSHGQHIFALPEKSTIHVIRLSTLSIIDHKPVRTSFHPYLDQEYLVWLQWRRDVQKVSGPKHRSIWKRQGGNCFYCGKPMLPDQEVELAEIMIGGGRKPQNLAYIHRRCAYDVLAEESDGGGVDVFQVLDGVMEQTNFEDPYWELREFFRHSTKSPLTLTFQQIEEIIGDKLDWEAYFCAAFWSDEVPGMAGELWDEEYPFDVIRPAARDFCIADAWLSQGYSIQRLRLLEKRAIFRKEVHGVSELCIPPALLEQKIPNDARYEVEEFLKDVVKKYGL